MQTWAIQVPHLITSQASVSVFTGPFSSELAWTGPQTSHLHRHHQRLQLNPKFLVELYILIHIVHGWTWMDYRCAWVFRLFSSLKRYMFQIVPSRFLEFPIHPIHSWTQNRPVPRPLRTGHGAASAATALLSRGTGWAAERANMPLMEPFLGTGRFSEGWFGMIWVGFLQKKWEVKHG